MKKKELVQRLYAALDTIDDTALAQVLSPTFTLTTVLTTQGWLSLLDILRAAFHGDFHDIVDIQEDGDNIVLTLYYQGRHTGSLDLSSVGGPVLPPTGQESRIGPIQLTFRMEESQITQGELRWGSDGGAWWKA